MDFEVAISNAIKAVWPNLRIRGCTFHLSQTIIRQLGKIYTLVNGRNKSLKVLYGLSVDFKLDVKKMFCLCFVPPLSIAEYFDDLCGSMTDEAKLLADWRLQLLGSDGNTVWFWAQWSVHYDLEEIEKRLFDALNCNLMSYTSQCVHFQQISQENIMDYCACAPRGCWSNPKRSFDSSKPPISLPTNTWWCCWKNSPTRSSKTFNSHFVHLPPTTSLNKKRFFRCVSN